MEKRTCLHCGVGIPADAHRRRIYCSKLCGQKARYRRKYPRELVPLVGGRECEWCAALIPERPRSGPEPKYCSRKCANGANHARRRDAVNASKRAATVIRLAAMVKSCPQCGVEFTPEQTPRQKFCSRKCLANFGRDRPGTVCSETDCDRLVRARGVCNMHYKRLLRAEGRLPNPEWDDRRRDNYHRRRARKAATATGEPVLLAEIAERDRWRCGLCGERVSRSKAWPDPMSPSIDHIVPLSEGGEHSLANVWLAHLQCNVRKGARGGGEQLALI